METKAEQHVFEVQVYLNDFDPRSVQAGLYKDGINGGSPMRQEMKLVRPLAGSSGGYVYKGSVFAASPSADDTARLTPHCDGVAIPLEVTRILWQR